MYQEEPDEFCVYCDSDWAADKKSRKSVSSYSIRYGDHLLDTSCARQSVVALSSGEAEYYALTRGSSAGLLVKRVLQEVQRGTAQTCLTDSTACKGIARRRGVGKVKHLSLKELWLQDAVEKGELTVKKEKTSENWADLGTKILDAPRVAELMSKIPLFRRGLVGSCLVLSAKEFEFE